MRTRRSSLCSALLASSILLTCPAVVLGQGAATREAVDPAARAAFEAGREAYDRGRFAEALSHFDRAYALSPNPVLLYNIGRAAEQDLQNERAVQAYEAYLSALERAENREFVEARLAKLRQLAGQSSPPPAPAAVTAAPDAPAYVSPSPAPYVSQPATVERNTNNERTIPGFRLYGGLHLGVGGEFAVEYDDDQYESIETDLDTTIGLQVGAGYAWRFFGIGGEVRTSWLAFGDDENVTRTKQKAIDIVVKPRGGYQLRHVPLEFYGTVPVGVSIPKVDESLGVDFHPGATIGFAVGVSYFFTRHVGVNAELGWNLYAYRFTDEDDDEGTVVISQLRPLTLNAMLAF